jgi:hypothetical protein
MRRIAFGLSSLVVFVFGVTFPCFAGMGSENYRIPTSVMSGGGGGMGSANYLMSSTVGQPSPLLNPNSPPESASYWLFPGFWYTLEFGAGCHYDLDGDGDVDAEDLAEFSNGLGTDFEIDEVPLFAEQFGRNDCGPAGP